MSNDDVILENSDMAKNARFNTDKNMDIDGKIRAGEKILKKTEFCFRLMSALKIMYFY